MQILVSTPWWFVVFCLLCGAAYSALLYKRSLKKPWHKLLAAIRCLVVSLLCFFLLNPVLVQWLNTEQKPKILMVMDVSESVNAQAPVSKTFIEEWQNAQAALGNDYEVEYLNLGSQLVPSDSIVFKDKRTNIAAMYDFVNQSYSRDNVGAVVLASDGIYNQGSNPLFKQLNKHSLLMCVGLGDTSLKKDVMVQQVRHNAIAYLNNYFPIEMTVKANACASESSVLSITHEGKTIYTQAITFKQATEVLNFSAAVLADKPGSQHYVVSIASVKGELTTVNNRKDVFVDIIDGREKIALIYPELHPDIGALKEAIEANQNYELKCFGVDEIATINWSDFSACILHQLPNRTAASKTVLQAIQNNNLPAWCIVGPQTAIELLPSLQANLRIEKSQGRFNDALGSFNNGFNGFVLDPNTVNTLNQLPPLRVPYGNYPGNGLEVLLYQTIGNVATVYPMWGFAANQNSKLAFLYGEGFWKWRLHDFMHNENHLATNELVSKTIQYLCTKTDRRKFRVYPSVQVFEEDQNAELIGELYNASYEPINTADIKVVLQAKGKPAYAYQMSKTEQAYRLNLGHLLPGVYQFKAEATGVNERINGQFIVKALQMELTNTQADHGLLRQMAKQDNGQLYKPADLKSLYADLKKRSDVVSIAYKEKKPEDLIHLKWLLFTLVGLLSLEWFIRKFEGEI
jgi:hypothetical protein